MSKKGVKKGNQIQAISYIKSYIKQLREKSADNDLGTIIKDSQTADSSPKASSKNIAYEFADVAKKTWRIKAIASQKTLYVYDENRGYFKPHSKDEFGLFLFKKFKKPQEQILLKSNTVNEIFHYLSMAPELQISLKDFNSTEEHLINLKNGVLNVKELSLKEHSPNYMFDYYLNVNFLEEEKYQKPEKFSKVLKQCFTEKEDRTLCKECLAYILSSNSSAKKVWFFVGEANTGKSMLLRLITRIIGEDFVAAIPLENLDGQFDLKSATHRRVNIVGEVSNLNLKNVTALKKITGKDKVRVEGKYEQSYFTTLNLKFLLAGNHLPRLDKAISDDDGIKNRFRFLGFYNPLDESERISDYDEILYEEEGDHIFSMLMRKLNELYERDFKFTETENSRALNEKFGIIRNNSIIRFVNECCEFVSDEKVSWKDLYNAYEHFCEYHCLTAQDKKSLWNYLDKLPSHPYKKKARIESEENPVQTVFGVKLV